MNDKAKSEQTEPAEQTEGTQQPESQAEPAQSEPAEEIQKPKMCKLAVLSIVCIVAAFAILALYLFSSEASIPLQLENLLMPAGVAILAIALIAGVIALVMIKASGGALGGRRLALLGIIVPIVVGVAFIRTSSPAEEPMVLPNTQCITNIRQLGAGLLTYAEANDGKLPAAQKWCDVLLEQANTDELLFMCPVAEEGMCNFALNKYAVEAGDDLPGDMVLLFESGPGWNQVGGPELFNAPHGSRRGNGGNVVFAGGRARSVSEDEFEELNWKGVRDSESEELESEEADDE